MLNGKRTALAGIRGLGSSGRLEIFTPRLGNVLERVDSSRLRPIGGMHTSSKAGNCALEIVLPGPGVSTNWPRCLKGKRHVSHVPRTFPPCLLISTRRDDKAIAGSLYPLLPTPALGVWWT